MATVKAHRRKTKHGRVGKPMTLKADHKAIVSGTTLFPGQVRTPDHDSILFKPGANNSKIGSHVAKGKLWAGFPIYTLALEERATCPRACEHWNDCYGNHMPFARRWAAGEALERAIPAELDKLAKKHGYGFVIRLHVLGDFYSEKYAEMWWNLMEEMPRLHIYGYTRREKTDPIGRIIDQMNCRSPSHCRIRWSERPGHMGTHTTTDVNARGRTPEGIVCPAQTEGEEVCCGNCSLCWSTTAPIVFIQH